MDVPEPTETNDNIKECKLTATNPARAMIDAYLATIGCNGIEPGSAEVTEKVYAEFVASLAECGMEYDADLESDAVATGLTVNEYAAALDVIVACGFADDVVAASHAISHWVAAAAAAYGSKGVLISAHATTTRVIGGVN